MTVMAISTARNNGELIEECVKLGYLTDDMVTLDPTYGLGRFWTRWRPAALEASDLDPDKSPIGRSVDCTNLPWSDSEFDAVVFDPPYKLNGTSTATGAATCDADYGVSHYQSWQDRMQLCIDGINEAHRVLKPGGMLLVKCQDQVCSGKVRWQTIEFTNHAVGLGSRLVDQLHLPSYRPQPAGRRQIHARRNYSTLLVLRKDVS